MVQCSTKKRGKNTKLHDVLNITSLFELAVLFMNKGIIGIDCVYGLVL